MGVERFIDGQHGNVKLNAGIKDACGNSSTISASQERRHVVLDNMLVRHHDGFRYGKPRPRGVIRAGTRFHHPNGIAELRTNRRRSQLDQAVRILQGEIRPLVQGLQERMGEAAERLEFERA